MIEECNENARDFEAEGTKSPFELSQVQEEYLKELNISSDVWKGMSLESQAQQLEFIVGRFNEIDLPEGFNKEETMGKLFSPEIVESYKQLEAPQDFIQIEQVSDVLAYCEELNFEHWQSLELSEKESVLNALEVKIAEIEHRPPCPVRLVNMPANMWGGFNPGSKTIDINRSYVEASAQDNGLFREILDTLVHEGRHAYQDYNVNVCEVHPRHSEVNSWAETMAGGKWGYHGDTSTLLGQRLYEQQSIEIDARNFAADVLDKFDQKQLA